MPVAVDAKSGNARFDAIVLAQHGDKKGTVQTRFSDLAEKPPSEVITHRPSEEEEAAAAARTRAALEGIVSAKIAHTRPGHIGEASQSRAEQSKYIRYTPAEDAPGRNAAISQRIVRVVEAPVDPLEPAKFKHKKVPGGPADAPVPILHSPPRKLTVADQQDWKIPPAISNWKNAKGYIIPLDKRLAADGRGLAEPTINDGFAKLSEALLIAERKARQEVETRNAIASTLAQKQKASKEAELRKLAEKARMQRSGIVSADALDGAPAGAGAGAAGAGAGAGGPRAAAGVGMASADEWGAEDLAGGSGGAGGVHAGQKRGRADSEEEEEGYTQAPPIVRQERESEAEFRERQQREEDRRANRAEAAKALVQGKKTKMMRDAERDISEQIALGQPVARVAATGEGMFDARLFNQSEGISSGFGADDEYNAYTKAWRSDTAASALYRPRAAVGGAGGLDTEAQLAALQGQAPSRFQGSTDFEGVERGAGARSTAIRTEPVQFEKVAVEADPFSATIDAFTSEVKGGAGGKQRGTLDGIGRSAGHGLMAAVGGGAGRSADDYAAGSVSGRPTRDIQFRSAGSQR